RLATLASSFFDDSPALESAISRPLSTSAERSPKTSLTAAAMSSAEDLFFFMPRLPAPDDLDFFSSSLSSSSSPSSSVAFDFSSSSSSDLDDFSSSSSSDLDDFSSSSSSYFLDLAA